MAYNRPSSPVVVDNDLQRLYEEVWEGFQSEDSQSPTNTTESAETTNTSASALSTDTSFSNLTFSAPIPRARTRVGARGTPDSSDRDKEDIARIYSVYATESSPDAETHNGNDYTGYGHSSTPTSANIYHHHPRPNHSYDYGDDQSSVYAASPISPVSTAAATYAKSTRSTNNRSSSDRDANGSGARRLPQPPTASARQPGHSVNSSVSSVSSSSRKLPATPSAGLPASPRLKTSPSPTRGMRERTERQVNPGPYLTPPDYVPEVSPTRQRSRSPNTYQPNRNVQVVSDGGKHTSPSLVTGPLPPSPRAMSYNDRKEMGINRWNSTASSTSTIINGINAQGQLLPPPPSFNHSQLQYPMPEPDPYYDDGGYYGDAGPSTIVRRPTDVLIKLRGSAESHHYDPYTGNEDNGEGEDYWEQYDPQQNDERYPDELYSSSQSQSSASRRNRRHRDWTYEYSEGNDEYTSDEFINYSLLSHLAIQLKDKVPREVHVKASIPYEGAFTGKDIVDTIQSLIRKHLLLEHSLNITNSSVYPSSASTSIDRKVALHIARSLQSQLLFYEVEGGERELSDGVEDVYMLLIEPSSPSASTSRSNIGGTELPLPTGVVTMLTRCYVPTCIDDKPCYAWDCPKRGRSIQKMLSSSSASSPYHYQLTSESRNLFFDPSPPLGAKRAISSSPYAPSSRIAVNSHSSGSSGHSRPANGTVKHNSSEGEKIPWKDTVPKEVLSRIPEDEVQRQVIIHDLVAKETEYLERLIMLETDFLRPLTEWLTEKIWSPEIPAGTAPSSSSPPLTPSAVSSGAGVVKTSSSISSFAPALQSLLPLLTALINSHTRLLESLRVRARESQYGIIERIGDLYLEKAAGEWKAGWGNGWIDGKGFVCGGGWTGDSGYDEWIAVWSTSGLGGMGIFSNNRTGDAGPWGNEEWKAVVAEQERHRQSLGGASGDDSGETSMDLSSLPEIGLKRFSELLALPATHLQSYPSLLSSVLASSSSPSSSSSSSDTPSSFFTSQANSTNPAANKTNARRGGKEREHEENPDASFLREAIRAMRALWGYGKVKTFQLSMNVGATEMNDGKGSIGEAALKWEWFDLVSEEERKAIAKAEMKRQAITFELIKGEMAYVKDLENVQHMYITPLIKSAESANPIIPPARLPHFISSIFNNIHSLHSHHLRLLQSLFRIQYEEHPTIRSVSAPMLDASLNWREAYMEYIPNYPIAAYTIDSEMRTNGAFQEFVQRCTRHPDAHRLDMKNFINRPIPRLLRYELLLKNILEETPSGPTNGIPGSSRQGTSSSSRGNGEHEDHTAIPQVLDVIRRLGKDTEPGVVSAKGKVELWRYNEGLVFKQGEWVDMDLLDEHRSLIHSGKLLRQTDGLEWSGWTEMYALLFDNYLVLTKMKDRDDVTKYHVNRRPIPLDLLTIDSLNEPPVQRSTGLLRGLRSQGTVGHEPNSISNDAVVPDVTTPTELSSPDISSSSSSRLLYPITLYHLGRHSPPSATAAFSTTALTSSPLPGTGASRIQSKPQPNIILYAESAAARAEWGAKLQEALGIRRVVQEGNKVFEVEVLSGETFLAPAAVDGLSERTGGGVLGSGWGTEGMLTGRVTCSVPFNTADGRSLVAIGCAEGVWIGFRHDPTSLRRVLHLKVVTQCAMLEDYGIFLVLADKQLFAYHIEALVPSSPQTTNMSQVPQKLNGNRDVHFFTVGTLHGRTLVIYMKKKGLDSIFRVLEPVSEKINERTRAPTGFGSRLWNRSPRSEWFKIYRDFFLPSESYDLVFLKARIAILCSKGFEIMDLNDFKSVTIPQLDDPRMAYLAKRCESCRPIGMFKSAEDEFLLCYNEFGVYVDKHGDPNRVAGTIEWEGTAERVAVHTPYVLLFDSRFIEVRHLETGRLVQIIPGSDIHCTWDGRGVISLNAVSPSAQTTSFLVPDRADEPLNQDALVHAVMNAPEVTRTRAIVQQVFELLPTVPLFLPDAATDSNANGSVAGSGSGSGASGASGSSGAPGSSGSRLSVAQHSNASSQPHSPQLRNQPSWA